MYLRRTLGACLANRFLTRGKRMCMTLFDIASSILEVECCLKLRKAD